MLSLRTAAGFSAALMLTIQLPARAVTFNIGDGDVDGFVAAVQASNNNIFGDTINLASGGRYEFSTAAANTNGPSALPSITSLITINGNGAILTRADGAPAMRFFRVNLSGNLTVNDLTLADGLSDAHGGGACRVESGRLTMSRCTLMNNHAPSAHGGAIFAPNGKLTFTNCTLSGNTCDGNGGALYCDDTGGRITLDCVTMNENSDANDTGMFLSNGATLTFAHSLLANGGCAVASATVNDLGHNLVDDGSCISAASSFSADPMLKPLSDNGGNSFTHALPFDSPAVDAIPPDDCETDADQRGTDRPNGTGCDIGAFEAIIPPSLSISDASEDEATGFLSFTITLSFAYTLDVSVDVTTSNGNALSGTDFVASQLTATIPAGALSTTVEIPVIDDGIEETNESLSVTLTNPTNALLDDDTGIGTIRNDDVAPTPICAFGLTIEADENCQADVDPIELLATDIHVDPRCAPLQLTADPTGPYPFGSNTVTITATDDCGQSNSCVATFDVFGGPSPQFVCPTSSLRFSTDNGSCVATMMGSSADPTIISGCDTELTIENDLNGARTLAGMAFPVGLTTVNWTITNIDGGIDACTTFIEVYDDESPTLSCPTGLTFDNAPESFAAKAIDNCDDAVTVVCTPATLSMLLEQGGNSVTCVATDSNGNASTCTFTLTDASDFDVLAMIDDMIDRVKQLHSDGSLSRRQSGSLVQVLKQARRKFANDLTETACNQINAFRAQVNSLVSDGVLNDAEAAPLLEDADEILVNRCGDEGVDEGEDESDSSDSDDDDSDASGEDGDDSETEVPPTRPECANASTLPITLLPLLMVSMRRKRKLKHNRKTT